MLSSSTKYELLGKHDRGFYHSNLFKGLLALGVILLLTLTLNHSSVQSVIPITSALGSSKPSIPAGVKVVGLLFFGRPLFVDILDCHLRANLKVNGGLLDEVRFVLHTDKQDDIDWLEDLIRRDSLEEYYKLLYQPDVGKLWDGLGGHFSAIWGDFATDNDTIYVKLDDDLTYIHHNAIERMVSSLLAHPEAYAILSNVINSRFTHYFHHSTDAIRPFLPDPSEEREELRSWKTSLLPEYPVDNLPEDPQTTLDQIQKPSSPGSRWLPLPRTAEYQLHTPFGNGSLLPDPKTGLVDPPPRWTIALQEHYSFLAALEEGEKALDKYSFGNPGDGLWNTWWAHYNINFLVFWGSTMKKEPFWTAEKQAEMPPGEKENDELSISRLAPAKLKMPVYVDTRALVAHYAFHWGGQKHELPLTDVLDRYRLLANDRVCSAKNQKTAFTK